MMREAASIGPATIALVEAIMKAKPHPEQGFRSCLGIMHLVRTHGSERVEAATRHCSPSSSPAIGSRGIRFAVFSAATRLIIFLAALSLVEPVWGRFSK